MEQLTLLLECYGTGWAYRLLFTPKPIPNDIAKLLQKKLINKKTDFEIFKGNLFQDNKIIQPHKNKTI